MSKKQLYFGHRTYVSSLDPKRHKLQALSHHAAQLFGLRTDTRLFLHSQQVDLQLYIKLPSWSRMLMCLYFGKQKTPA